MVYQQIDIKINLLRNRFVENLDELIKTKRLVTYYLYREANTLNLPIKELPLDEGKEISQKAIKKYFDPKTKEPLLSYAVNPPLASKQFPDQWGIIGELKEVPNDFLVFFEPYKDNHVIQMENIKDFSLLVEETIIFEYYITNRNLDFLIALETSAQILIGAGDAKEWVENLIQRHST